MIELRHYRYFVAVAETLHFGRAAQRLHMSQPPLSQQIRQLESLLEVQLLARTQRSVQLTEAGRAFLPEAQRVLCAHQQAVQSARDASQRVAGRLEIGFVSSAPFGFLPRVLSQFRQRFPQVQLSLHELGTAQQLQALKDRQLDLGLVRLPARSAQVRLEVLEHEALVAAIPEEHPLAGLAEIELAQLAQESWLLFPRRTSIGLYDRILELCLEAGFAPHITQEVEQMPALVALVGAGLGVSLVPESLRAIKTPGSLLLPLSSRPVVEMALALPLTPLGPAQQAFVDLAREQCGESLQDAQAMAGEVGEVVAPSAQHPDLPPEGAAC